MRRDVERALSESARYFKETVWPAVSPQLGGGELVPTEAATAAELQRDLDLNAGIDAFQIIRGRQLVRAIASRVSLCRADLGSFDTFTIRFALAMGGPTEFDKRLAAIRDDQRRWLYPNLTIQSYRERGTDRLVAVGIVRTADLFTYAEQFKDAEIMRAGQRRPRAKPYKEGVTGGNTMLVVPWAGLLASGVELLKWQPSLEAA